MLEVKKLKTVRNSFFVSLRLSLLLNANEGSREARLSKGVYETNTKTEKEERKGGVINKSRRG